MDQDISVKFSTPNTIKVEFSPSGALTQGYDTGMVLKSGISYVVPKSGISDVTKLDQLGDVIEPAFAEDGSTLVYQANTSTYIVKPMNIDGGSF